MVNWFKRIYSPILVPLILFSNFYQYLIFSYWMLFRLLTASSSDFFGYWLAREKLLFKNRLNQISPRQFCRLLKSIIRQLKRRDKKQNSVDVDSALLNVSLHYLQTDVFNHITDRNHSFECRSHRLKGLLISSIFLLIESWIYFKPDFKKTDY